MKFLSDFFPIALFFIVYAIGYFLIDKDEAIYIATAVAVAASVLQIAWLLLRRQPVTKMQWINLAIIVVMGGLTLILHDKRFMLWKPTILYWVFAATLLLAPFVAGKNLLKTLMGSQISLPEPIWGRLNLAWIVFLVFLGSLNLFVAFNYAEAVWVAFKTFGMTGIMVVFALLQGLWMSKHILDEEPTA